VKVLSKLKAGRLIGDDVASGVAPGPIDVDKYAVAVVRLEVVFSRFTGSAHWQC